MFRFSSLTLLYLSACLFFYCGPKVKAPAAKPALPAVEQAAPAISLNPRTAASVSSVINDWQDPIQFCYRKTIRKNPAVKGKVVVRFTILPAGQVADVTVVSETVKDQGLVECVSRSVSRLRFPPVHESLGSLTVTYPFTFG